MIFQLLLVDVVVGYALETHIAHLEKVKYGKSDSKRGDHSQKGQPDIFLYCFETSV